MTGGLGMALGVGKRHWAGAGLGHLTLERFPEPGGCRAGAMHRQGGA